MCKKFSGCKSLKDCVKPCIRENNSEYVILHVGANELNFELTPQRIAKSIIDVGKNVQTIHRTVSISRIVPRNANNKVTEVNKELSKMCKRENYFLLIIATLTQKHTSTEVSYT